MSDTTKNEAIGNTAADLKSLGDAARTVTDRAGQAGADAVQQARALAGDAASRASVLLGTAQDKAAAAAEAQKQGAAEYLEGVAKAVHRSGEALEGHQDFIAQMVERGADELASLASTLRTNDLQSLLGSLGSLAKRQPALFVGASMAAGFTLARVGRLAASGATGPAASAALRPVSTTAETATGPGMPALLGTTDPSPAAPPAAGTSQAFGEQKLPYAMGYPGDTP